MPPVKAEVVAFDELRAALQINRELGRSIRPSFDVVIREALPKEMKLLLLRVALAEAIEKLASE
jgi:hypothetical protein